MSAQLEDLFLNEEQTDHLTGISRGETIKGEKFTKYQLQVAFLRNRGIPFTENARGKAVVTRMAIEGRQTKEVVPKGWQPKVVGR